MKPKLMKINQNSKTSNQKFFDKIFWIGLILGLLFTVFFIFNIGDDPNRSLPLWLSIIASFLGGILPLFAGFPLLVNTFVFGLDSTSTSAVTVLSIMTIFFTVGSLKGIQLTIEACNKRWTKIVLGVLVTILILGTNTLFYAIWGAFHLQ